MKFLYSFFAFLIVLPVFSQGKFNDLKPLSEKDKAYFASLPEFKLPESKLNRTLPYKVDNSQSIHFRPIFSQEGYSCAQASSIGYLFTYEINVKRNADASLPENQYPTHFAYNFMNSGFDEGGICFWETYEILRQCGTPNVETYGGMYPNENWYNVHLPWMSGYDNYYQGMKNRLNKTYSFKVNTIEGLNTLKNWIYDHGNDSEDGGCAIFFGSCDGTSIYLPSGTEEEGKTVLPYIGSEADHALTFVGYNDSIRYDYNNDGQYTNNIDLNGDDIIDIRDWEIGGLKLANSWDYWWGNEGFAYLMYKVIAETEQPEINSYGIWDNRVVIIDPKAEYEPLLTAKINLSHPCRNKIKVNIGVATTPNATEPEHFINYSIFNFQGGEYPMTSSENEIEFGLDMNSLLEYVEPNQNARFFLMVYENDATDLYEGTINSFSILDYSGNEVVEYPCQQENVTLSNGLNLLHVDATLNNELPIIDSNLPPFQFGEPYQTQLSATQGTEPYNWNIVCNYEIETDVAELNAGEETQIVFENNESDIERIELPFDFDFYGKKYDSIYVSTDGFLTFDEGKSTWLFYTDGRIQMKYKSMIAPCFALPFEIDNANDDGIWYSIEDSCISFRWKLSVHGQSGATVEQQARLYDDGRIEFYYGENTAATWVKKYGGISAGDGQNFIDLNPVGTYNVVEGVKQTFTPINQTEEISLTSDGLLSALIESNQEISVKIKVTDNNNLASEKTLTISSVGVSETLSQNIDLDIYPNPATDHINLKVDTKNGNKFTLRIIDQLGRIIYEYTENSSQSTFKFDTSKFSSGVYVVSVVSDNETIVKKIICQ